MSRVKNHSTALNPTLFRGDARKRVQLESSHPVFELLTILVCNGLSYSLEPVGNIPLFLGMERFGYVRVNQHEAFLIVPWMDLKEALLRHPQLGHWIPATTKITLKPGMGLDQKAVQYLISDFQDYLKRGAPKLRLVRTLPLEKLPNLHLLEIEKSRIFRGEHFDIQWVSTKLNYEILIEDVIWQLPKSRHVDPKFVERHLVRAFTKKSALEARNYFSTEFQNYGVMK